MRKTTQTMIDTLELLSKLGAAKSSEVARAFNIKPPAGLGRLRTLQRYGLAIQREDASWIITPAGRTALKSGPDEIKPKSLDRRRQRAMKRLRKNPAIAFQPSSDPFFRELHEADFTKTLNMLGLSPKEAERVKREFEENRGCLNISDEDLLSEDEALAMGIDSAKVRTKTKALKLAFAGIFEGLKYESEPGTGDALRPSDVVRLAWSILGALLAQLARVIVKAEGLPETPENFLMARSRLMAVSLAAAQVEAGVKTLDEVERELEEMFGEPEGMALERPESN